MDIETYRLAYVTGATDIKDEAALVFGRMVALATEVMEAYHSDLYYDAMWLSRHLVGERLSFYYSFDRSGTTIGFKDDAMRVHAYRLTVWMDGGATMLSVEESA